MRLIPISLFDWNARTDPFLRISDFIFSSRRALTMISRTTIVAFAVASLGLFSSFARAQYPQYPSYYPAMPIGYLDSMDSITDMGGCDEGCDGRCDAGCAEKATYAPHSVACLCPTCRPRAMWASFDALLWWGKGRSMPALVTTSPQGTDRDDAGVLDDPDTAIYFGNGGVGHDVAGGARADFGFWFNHVESLGMGARIWGIKGDTQGLVGVGPGGNPILARPFYNVVSDEQDALLVSFPSVFDGGIDVETSSDLLATEAYLRAAILWGSGYNLDLVGGYSFMRFDDDLLIHSNSASTDPGGLVPVGTIFDITDVFDARNEFHGGHLGLIGEVRRGCWSFRSLLKCSVGNMHQIVNIDGSTTIVEPALAPVTNAGGLLALPTNIGSYSRDRVGWIPEFGFTVGYKPRRWLELTAGYNVIWMSSVVLSGDQIDTGVNLSQSGGNPLIGPARPAFDFRETEYWMQGFTFGATVNF